MWTLWKPTARVVEGSSITRYLTDTFSMSVSVLVKNIQQADCFQFLFLTIWFYHVNKLNFMLKTYIFHIFWVLTCVKHSQYILKDEHPTRERWGALGDLKALPSRQGKRSKGQVLPYKVKLSTIFNHAIKHKRKSAFQVLGEHHQKTGLTIS